MSYFINELEEFLKNHAEKDINIRKINEWKNVRNINLEVIITKKEGLINFEDCNKIHKLIYLWVKNQNLNQKCNISVLSESIDKELYDLKDFEENIEKKVKIELKEKKEDRKIFTGFIKKINNDRILIKSDSAEYEINWHDIKKAKIVPDFDLILRKK